ncbi:MAG: hypothetical protein Q9164_000802 [Protoblastenia rupestris]
MGYATNATSTSGRSNSQHTRSSLTTSNSSPRRRLMAIQDMLNPFMEDVRPSASPSLSTVSELEGNGRASASPSLSSESGIDEDDHSLGRGAVSADRDRSPTSRRSSRRGRLSSSARSRSSRSSMSPDVQARSRAFRPAYNDEMANFIWFLKVDLGRQWDDILIEYNRQFPEDTRDKGGLQCKFYRHIKKYNIPQTRFQQRNTNGSSRFGTLANTRRRYPWMLSFASNLPGLELQRTSA